MAAASVSPPEQLLAAFEVDRRELRPLQGGQGTAWGTAALVFKPVDMSIEALQWQERVLGGTLPACAGSAGLALTSQMGSSYP